MNTDRRETRLEDLLSGLLALLEYISMATTHEPEYVECQDCEFWRGEDRPFAGRSQRECRRHAADMLIPDEDPPLVFQDFGCGEGVKRFKAAKEG